MAFGRVLFPDTFGRWMAGFSRIYRDLVTCAEANIPWMAGGLIRKEGPCGLQDSEIFFGLDLVGFGLISLDLIGFRLDLEAGNQGGRRK